MRALILDAPEARGALAGVRGLRAAGWDVGVGAPGGRSLAATSRDCSRRHDIPGPERGEDRFVAAVEAAIRAGSYEVVLAAADAQMLVLSARREAISAAVPHPAHDVLLRAVDKLELTRAAERAGLAVPATWAPPEPRPAEVAGPVVVKPRLHFDPGGGAAELRREAVIAPDAAGAEEAASRLGWPVVLQEQVAGRLVAVSCVRGPDGPVTGWVQQVADVTWPTGGGISARARTVAVDERLADGVEALLTDLGWTGLAQVQFLDPGDGRPRAIDLNGRLYGSLSLAVAAGANLPALWAAVATGRDVPDVRGRPGVTYQWLEGDLRAALADANRVRALGGVAATAVRASHSVWSLRDPAPAGRYLLEAVRRVRRRQAQAPLPASANS